MEANHDQERQRAHALLDMLPAEKLKVISPKSGNATLASS